MKSSGSGLHGMSFRSCTVQDTWSIIHCALRKSCRIFNADTQFVTHGIPLMTSKYRKFFLSPLLKLTWRWVNVRGSCWRKDCVQHCWWERFTGRVFGPCVGVLPRNDRFFQKFWWYLGSKLLKFCGCDSLWSNFGDGRGGTWPCNTGVRDFQDCTWVQTEASCVATGEWCVLAVHVR